MTKSESRASVGVQPMRRLFWQLRYVRLALRSPYDITHWEAWQEARASWEMNNDERGSDPMPAPGEAIYHDQMEWRER